MDFNFTQPYVLGDFKEWHKGIPYYGFWALEIDSEKVLSEIFNAQSQLTPILHAGYQRQPHITLLACGLMDENYFSAATLTKQINELKELNIDCFDLNFLTFNSFSTCPYLALEKPPILDQIRQGLMRYQAEDSPCEYTPHITLGFYNDVYEKSDIESKLRTLEKTLALTTQTVSSIVFARYNTSDLQGPYEVLERICLNNKQGQILSNT